MSVTYSLYAVRDRKSTFMDPVPMVSDGVAIRNFAELLRSVKESTSDDLLMPYSDLELYRLGTYDLVSGLISPEMPVLLSTSCIIDNEEVHMDETQIRSCS